MLPVQVAGSVASPVVSSSRSMARVAVSSASRCSVSVRWARSSAVTWVQGGWPWSRMARTARISARDSPAAWAARINASLAWACGG
jgi:hypothetical protein